MTKLEKIIKDEIPEKIDYFSYSTCRLCDKTNGSIEYRLIDQNNIIFTFGEGLLHYYKVHKVQPSKEFVKYILNFEPTNMNNEISKMFGEYDYAIDSDNINYYI